ncbi:MAG TPA: hypothetical protein VGP13_04045 [Candidatus Paceibacterota bacterium]|jgi:hypothetical protein|nr:hypothetical protein [Candidatus Paceibacterota bacterium]
MQEDKNKQSGLSWSAPSQTPLMPQKPTTSVVSGSAPEPKKSPHNTSVQNQAPIYAGLLVGGIIVGVLLATAWSSFNHGSVSATATSTMATSGTMTATTSLKGSTVGAPLVVDDQAAGSNVTITKLTIAKPTWVVVYVSREGKPGNALGARLFFPGDKEGSVGLLRDTEAGQSYFVGLSVDNGDRVFSLSSDKPLADVDGGPLWATFRAR